MPLRPRDCDELREVVRGKATNYRYNDVARWLKRADCILPTGGGGSHETWRHPSGRKIPMRRGTGVVLPAYVKKVARILLEVECQTTNAN